MEKGKGRKVSLKKWRDLVTFAVFSLVVIASHQNCAPAHNMANANVDASPVDVIDNVKRSAAVSFALKELQLSSQLSQIALEGQCSLEQQDAILAWEVRKQSDPPGMQPFAEGRSVCDGGKFLVELAPTQNLECGEPYVVKARLGRGPEGQSILTRACPRGT